MLVFSILACSAPLGSRCELDGGVRCSYESQTVWTEIWPRRVLHQLPMGEAPEQGWPAVLLFQGLSAPAQSFWVAPEAKFKGWPHQAMLTATLLDAGYAVLTPVARGAGMGCWDSNLWPLSEEWERSPDHALMVELFEAIESGDYGTLDSQRLYAGGISSGGYMSSRVGIEYPGRFQGLLIHSGSYMSCAGALCEVPEELPEHHPPTLFLHGGEDRVVPAETMHPYAHQLEEMGLPVQVVEDPELGHGWHEDAPSAALEWFER